MRTNSTVCNIGPWRVLQRFFLASDWEVVFGWIAAEFSLFAVFSPFVTKLAAMNSCSRLVRLLKEEDSLMVNPSVPGRASLGLGPGALRQWCDRAGGAA